MNTNSERSLRTMHRAMGSKEWALLATLAVLWGGSFFFGEVALGALPPFSVALCRVGVAATALWLLAAVRGQKFPTSIASWRAFVVMGVLNNVIPFSLILWGQTEIASGLAAILNATTPLFTVVLAHLVTVDEKLDAHRLFGVLLGFTGVVIMTGPQALSGMKLGFDAHLLAQLAILAAAVSYAFAGLYGRRFARQPPITVAAGQLTGSTLVMLPVAALVDRPWTLAAPSVTVTLAVLGLALLSTAIAYVIYFRILAVAGASNLLLVTFLIPPTALALGIGILGEAVGPRQVAGMVAIGLGLAAIDGRALRAGRPRATPVTRP